MNKKYINLLMIVFCFIVIILCFQNNTLLTTSIISSAQIFLTKVFPFLFVMMIINNLLISFNFPYYLSKIIPSPYIYIFIMSALSGSPVNASIISTFLEKNIFNERQASIALCFTTLNNPLFLYNYFNLIFSQTQNTVKLFLIIYTANIILMLFFLMKEKNNENYYIKYSFNNIKKDLMKGITNTLSNLLNIFAIITFFKLICDVLITDSSLLGTFIKGIIEITQGLNELTILNATTKIKELLILVILSFAGLSIHIQISNILSPYNINYKYFYLTRFVLILLTIFMCLLL